jgi:hypothetical protein
MRRKRRQDRGGKAVRRFYAILILSTIALTLSACGGGSSNTSVNSGRADDESTVNSERIESSNMAPTGGPGPEPENGGAKSSGNANEGKADNKNKTDNKAENKNKNTQ